MTRSELADKIEALDGPCREMDAEIGAIFDPENDLTKTHYLEYTASIDAALTLVPEGWVNVSKWVYPHCAYASILMDEDGEVEWRGLGKIEALAICAAALRAGGE